MKKDIMKAVKITVNKTTLKMKKYSPEILVVAGVAGTVVSTVLACKATTKLSAIMDGAKTDIDTIHKCAGNTELSAEYSKEDAKKDLAIVYAQTGVKIAKIYAPSIVVGTLSITGIIASHNMMKKRNVALAAAYATVDKAYKDYRGRVIERFGENVDKELCYNIKAKKIEETVKDPETGKEKKVKSNIGIADGELNGYTCWFDESCANYEGIMDYDMLFLRSQQQYANDRLRAEGSLFLSDIYEALGIKRTKMSQSVGWIYSPDNQNGDNFIDFGILETYREMEDGSLKKSILLDFNVDGPILELI